MNAKQEAKLSMDRAVEQHLDENPAIIAAVPAYVAAFAALKAVIIAILNTVQLKSASLTGIAADKSNLKQTLAQFAADITGIIKAYAMATGNNTLKKEVDFTISILSRRRDEELVTLCQMIHSRGTENKTALIDYGVTGEKLIAFQTAIDNFAAALPKPRTALSARKTYNANLAALFKQNDALLDQMDGMMGNFRESNPDFYNTYFNLREIPDPHTTTTQLKGVVTNKADETPIKDAIITIVELSKTQKTKSSGEYHFKPIPNGTYTVRVTAQGFQNFEIDEVAVKLGEINHLDVALTIN